MNYVTQWFRGTPVNLGVFQRRAHVKAKPCFAHWNGVRWGRAAVTAEEAFALRRFPSAVQNNFDWRGIAK